MFALALLLALLTPLFEPQPFGTPHPRSPGDPGCATQPLYATGANGNVTTVNASYKQFPQATGTGTVAITTGVSCGPQNKWLVTAILVAWAQNGATNSASYACIQSPTPGFTLLDAPTFAGPASICNPTPANVPLAAAQIAGGQIFGGINLANIVQGSSQVTESHLTVPNNFAYSQQCLMAANGSGGVNVIQGYCAALAEPI